MYGACVALCIDFIVYDYYTTLLCVLRMYTFLFAAAWCVYRGFGRVLCEKEIHVKILSKLKIRITAYTKPLTLRQGIMHK